MRRALVGLTVGLACAFIRVDRITRIRGAVGGLFAAAVSGIRTVPGALVIVRLLVVLGGLLVAAWAIALAMGPEPYAIFKDLLGSPLDKFVMFGMSLSAFYHLGNGVRHLIWDLGYGLDKDDANSSAFVVFGFSIAATIAVWVIAYMTGAL